MILGLTIPQFTALHVLISFVGIGAGLIALPAFARGHILPRTNAIFLWFTLLTSLTGFLFPIVAFTPALGTGIVSTLVLAVAFWAWYGRKLAGVLCERHGDSVIAGVGINVNQRSFAPEIALRATSLLQIDGQERPLEMVQRAFLKTLAPFYENWRQNGFAAIHPLIVPCDALKGKQVSVLQTDSDATPVSGLCGGIQADGTLLVGDARVFAGEAHVEL